MPTSEISPASPSASDLQVTSSHAAPVSPARSPGTTNYSTIIAIAVKAHEKMRPEAFGYAFNHLLQRENCKVVVICCLSRVQSELGNYLMIDDSFGGISPKKLEAAINEQKKNLNHYLKAFREGLTGKGVKLDIQVSVGRKSEDILVQEANRLHPLWVVLDSSWASFTGNQHKIIQAALHECNLVLMKNSKPLIVNQTTNPWQPVQESHDLEQSDEFVSNSSSPGSQGFSPTPEITSTITREAPSSTQSSPTITRETSSSNRTTPVIVAQEPSSSNGTTPVVAAQETSGSNGTLEMSSSNGTTASAELSATNRTTPTTTAEISTSSGVPELSGLNGPTPTTTAEISGSKGATPIMTATTSSSNGTTPTTMRETSTANGTTSNRTTDMSATVHSTESAAPSRNSKVVKQQSLKDVFNRFTSHTPMSPDHDPPTSRSKTSTVHRQPHVASQLGPITRSPALFGRFMHQSRCQIQSSQLRKASQILSASGRSTVPPTRNTTISHSEDISDEEALAIAMEASLRSAKEEGIPVSSESFAPSAPPLPLGGPIRYPSVDTSPVQVDFGYPGAPTNSLPPEQRQKAEDKSRGRCIICYDEPADAVCIPCGHIACCKNCLMHARKWGCPVCRAKVEQVIKVYQSI